MKQEESQQHKNPEYYQYQEDEVELIDYLRVIWKWKWLIIVGTFLCVLAAGVYGFTRPVVRMYKVSALIEIDPKAKLDPLDKIKSIIEYGIFNQQIQKELSILQGITKPESLTFEVNIPKGLNILDIAYKTPNLDLGKAVLNTLINQLEQEYKERIEQVEYQFDETIKKKGKSIKNIQANIQQIKLESDNNISKSNSAIKNIQANIQQIKFKSDNNISKSNSAIKNIQANIQQIKLESVNNISKLNSYIKNIQANIQMKEKEFEISKINNENAIRTHTENIKSLTENIGILKNNINEIKNALKQAQSNSENLAGQREVIILDSQNKTGLKDVFIQAAAIQNIIDYPIVLTDRIRSLSFKQGELSIEILSENHKIKEHESQIQILEMQKNDTLRREQDKIGELEAKIQILEMQKNDTLRKEQGKIKEHESQIQILEMQKNDTLRKEQDKIGELEAKIQIIIELKVDQNISVEKDKIAVLKSEIETLKRDKITGVTVKQPPTASLIPIKYKIKRNTLLAGVVGLFMFLFLAFFIEYIKKASKHNGKVV